MRNQYPFQLVRETSWIMFLGLANLICDGRNVQKLTPKTISCTFRRLGITSHGLPLVPTRTRSWHYMLTQVGRAFSARETHQLGVLVSN